MPDLEEKSVLFVDVSGSTRLYETVGDAAAHARIDGCVRIFRQKTIANGGYVVKTIGDEVMSVFDAPSAAADAAVEMQEAIEKLPALGGERLGVRIGLHHGAVVEREGDVFGDTVNVAARLVGIAAKGQIMTTRETVQGLTDAQRASARRLYTIEVKGKSQHISLYEILWQAAGDQTTLSSDRSVVVSQKAKSLRIRYLEREFVLDGTKPITIGRDKDADLVVYDRMASRSHANIEYRLGKFVFSDHSANSTYITMDGEPELVLRREELVLKGHGFIAFGQSRESATEVAEFTCE